jgi:hypothetical protein
MSNSPIGVKRVALAAMAAACAVALSAPASAAPLDDDDSPPSDRVVVDVVTINGSGCRVNSPDQASVYQSPDNTYFKIIYPHYKAEAGDHASPTAFRKNCLLALQFHVPQGFTYAITRVDYYGSADLADGATAKQRANYYFQGDAANNVVEHVLPTSYTGRWHHVDEKAEAELVWSPCGEWRNLNINTELRVTANAAKDASWISMGKTTGDVDTLYHFSWKRC